MSSRRGGRGKFWTLRRGFGGILMESSEVKIIQETKKTIGTKIVNR